jgi:hypothetical protein
MPVSAAGKELPRQQYWLSFAGADGFHGCVIVHAKHFTEALLEASLHGCERRAGDECQGRLLPTDITIPKEFAYRLLDRAEVARLDALLGPMRLPKIA